MGYKQADFVNISTKRIRGFQITSFLNIAHKVEGTQIAVFNYADSVKGVPIGVLSIVKNGYRRISLSANEIFPLQLSVKTGVKKFYNIFTTAIAPFGDKRYWAFGYGLGNRLSGRKAWGIQTELTALQIHEMNNLVPSLNMLNQANLSVLIPIHKSIELNAGPSINVHISQWQNDSGNIFQLLRLIPFGRKSPQVIPCCRLGLEAELV